MNEGNGTNGRIHLLGQRKTKDKGSDFATNAKAQEIAVKVCEYYMQQVPGLVAHMIADALKASGIELKPPPATDAPVGDATGVPAEVVENVQHIVDEHIGREPAP